MTPASRHHAFRALRMHSFARGRGYLAFALHELPVHGALAALCAPPADTADGSIHFLEAPSGPVQVRMQWVAPEHAWMPYPTPHPSPIFHRPMAHSAAFLGSHGWKYAGAAPGSPLGTFYSRVKLERA